MAMLVQREKRYKVAVQLFSELAYLDYCRCANTSTGDADAVRRVPPFEAYAHKVLGMSDPGPDSKFAPGLLYEIQPAMQEGQVDLSAAREIFMFQAQEVHKNMKAPYPPEDAWKALEKALSQPP